MQDDDEFVEFVLTKYRDTQLYPSEVEFVNSFTLDDIVPILKKLFFEEEDDIMQSTWYRALLSLNEFHKVAFILELFETPEYAEWQYALTQDLSYSDDSRSVEKLCDLLANHDDSNIRFVAAESLEKVGNASSIAVLEYAIANDKGKDYYDCLVADAARDALKKVRERVKK